MSEFDGPAEYDPKLDRSFRGHKGPIHALDFNVNMKQLAGASLDHCVYVWNFRQQLRAFRFMGHTVSSILHYKSSQLFFPS
jgi:centriolar protein POC1